MPFRIFDRVLRLALCTNALTVYLDSHAIRTVIIATLACALLLQVGYFGSVLLLFRLLCLQRRVWKS
ncbi:Exopolysaccharide production repressor [Microvirga lotononidis]|uniref:Exopolysaccharide production repressor n=1 Tax=Microvirga lotononidis TaxID=864069 RepID=I4Z3D6_9HYPH|nr:Exopolysaccharide production repressor [Microvirga lotononidis]